MITGANTFIVFDAKLMYKSFISHACYLQVLSALGYHVLVPDYRGKSTFPLLNLYAVTNAGASDIDYNIGFTE